MVNHLASKCIVAGQKSKRARSGLGLGLGLVVGLAVGTQDPFLTLPTFIALIGHDKVLTLAHTLRSWLEENRHLFGKSIAAA